jgi:hypothetical protein
LVAGVVRLGIQTELVAVQVRVVQIMLELVAQELQDRVTQEVQVMLILSHLQRVVQVAVVRGRQVKMELQVVKVEMVYQHIQLLDPLLARVKM